MGYSVYRLKHRRYSKKILQAASSQCPSMTISICIYTFHRKSYHRAEQCLFGKPCLRTWNRWFSWGKVTMALKLLHCACPEKKRWFRGYWVHRDHALLIKPRPQTPVNFQRLKLADKQFLIFKFYLGAYWIWVILKNCVPLGVVYFKSIFQSNLLLQCQYFDFMSLYIDVRYNKNNVEWQCCVLCTLIGWMWLNQSKMASPICDIVNIIGKKMLQT